MTDSDPFSSSRGLYGGGDVFEEEGVIQKITGAIRPYLGHIILLLIVGGIGYALYWYFVGSIATVTVTVKGEDNQEVGNVVLDMFDPTGKAVFSGSGSSIYTTQLRFGDGYRITASAPGFKQASISLDVQQASVGTSITLKKDVPVSFKGEIAIADQIIAGQTAVAGTLTLENSGNKDETVQLVFEGAEDYLNVNVSPANPVVKARSERTISLLVTTLEPDAINFKNAREGDEVTGTVRILGLGTSQEAAFTMLVRPEPVSSIRWPSDIRSRVRPGESKVIKVRITNSNRFPIEKIDFKVDVQDAPANTPIEVRQWITYPQGQVFEKIRARETGERTIMVSPPLDSKKDQISGLLVFNAPFLERAEQRTFSLTIGSELDIDVDLSLIGRSIVRWDDVRGEFDTRTLEMRLYNRSDLDLGNILLFVENVDECVDPWLTFVEGVNVSIPELGKGESREVIFRVSAPLDQFEVDEPMFCHVCFRFNDPLTAQPVSNCGSPDIIEIVPDSI